MVSIGASHFSDYCVARYLLLQCWFTLRLIAVCSYPQIAYTLRLHPSVSSRSRLPRTAAATDAHAHRLAPAGAFPDDMAEGSLKTEAAQAAVTTGPDTGEGGDSAMAGAAAAGGKLAATAGGGGDGGHGLLVEQCASLTLAVGHGVCAAPPAVSAAIKALAVGGRARVR